MHALELCSLQMSNSASSARRSDSWPPFKCPCGVRLGHAHLPLCLLSSHILILSVSSPSPFFSPVFLLFPWRIRTRRNSRHRQPLLPMSAVPENRIAEIRHNFAWQLCNRGGCVKGSRPIMCTVTMLRLARADCERGTTVTDHTIPKASRLWLDAGSCQGLA